MKCYAFVIVRRQFYHLWVFCFFAWNKIDISKLVWKTLDPDTFLGHNGLNNLSANHNELQTLPEDVFARTNLSFLDLSFNQIQMIESIAKAGVTRLETLIISHNIITTINDTTFKNFSLLKILDLSFNHLTSIGPIFDSIPRLKHLSMAHNNLTSLRFTVFTHLRLLESLDVSNNRLTRIYIEAKSPVFQYLQRINMESNFITNVELSSQLSSTIPNLRYLNLLDNKFFCRNLQNIFDGYDLTKLEYEMDKSEKMYLKPAFRGISCHWV